MRLRSWVVLIMALLTATTAMAGTSYPPRTGGNYTGSRWYGYFYNNGYVAENAQHTNVTMVGATVKNDGAKQWSDATTIILQGLAEARKNGEQAMVDVESIVFAVPDDLCYQNDPTAAADFQSFVQTLIGDGYLVPNDPEISTVSSFYVADEPDGNCLYDALGTHTPNPVLLNAISAIRQNANTTNFPLATIVTQNHYGNMPEGLGLFDWVGLDDYSNDVTTYMSDFASFESSVQANDVVGGTSQQFILVPLVSSGVGTTYINGAPYVQSKFLADNKVIGVMPFRWNNGGTSGMVGTSWASSYIALGKSIAFPYATVETVLIVDSLVAH